MPEVIANSTKAALMMLMLGEQPAAEIFRRLNRDEIRRLSRSMGHLSGISERQTEDIMEQFYALCQKGDPMMLENGSDYLRSLALNALGEEAGRRLVTDLDNEDQMKLVALDPVDARTLSNLVRKEHPQTIALIMAYIDASKSAEVIAQLPIETQVEVCLRMASLDSVSPQTLRDVEAALMSEMKGLVVSGGEETSGIQLVAEILNSIEKQHEEAIFEQLTEIDPELAEEIRNNMFVFDDLVNLDDRGIQALLKEVDNQSLLLALKTASEGVREKVFKNLSARAVEMLREDMDVMGPTKLSDVEKAQSTITQLALRLESEGKIVIAKAGADDEFV
ncbi:flagellar motor switch protein FliG [Myxococcota bacterium]|nr:flagellar motor switch protein FliG [Myxococcota bacterium]MBU1429662.1 flagellar motor switch protein FliG [Myxococcota bacterium]